MANQDTDKRRSRRAPATRPRRRWAAEARDRVQRVRLRAADHRRGRADQPDRHARVRPPRPDREPRLHAVAGVEGRSSRNLPDYLTVKAYISKELPPELQTVSRRTCATCWTSTARTRRASSASRPSIPARQEDRGRGRRLQGAEAAGAGDARRRSSRSAPTTSASASSTRARTKRSRRSTQVEGLEYQISSLLKRLTQKKQKIAVTNGHGEAELGYLKHIDGVRGHATSTRPPRRSPTTSTR